MQPIELALFVVVAVLALALIGTVVRPHLRSRPAVASPAPDGAATGAPEPPGKLSPSVGKPAVEPMICPACHRDYPPGLQFCSHDARSLVPASHPAARRAGAGTTCPVCRRSFEAGKRFCAFDGEELVPLTVAVGGIEGGVQLPGLLGKICPNCSRRYESEATFCGLDGEHLVIVN
ncbi:MAG TPA: hypothetical protein VFG23_23165 [Polyangia bacterium]|nr:hypothetical protein [Polyangia bacterium]